jgi:MFS family permease
VPRRGWRCGTPRGSMTEMKFVAEPSGTSPVRDREFLAFWASDSLSRLGDALVVIGLAWHVLRETGSAGATGGFFLAQLIPAFVVGPHAGVVADRCDRRKVAMVCDLVRAAVCAALGAAATTGHLTVPAVYVGIAGLSASSSYFDASRGAALAVVARRTSVARATSIMTISRNVADIAGRPLGGIVVAAVGIRANLAVDALSFLASALCLRYTRMCRGGAALDRASRRPTLEALRYLWSNVPARVALLGLILANVVAPVLLVALPLLAEQRGFGATGYGVMNGVVYAGQFLPALLLLSIGRECGPLWLAAGLAAAGLGLAGMGMLASLPGVLLLLLLIGTGLGSSVLLSSTITQTAVSDEFMGRVVALRRILARVAPALIFVLFPVCTGIIGLRAALACAGLLVAVMAVIAIAPVRLARHRPELEH